VGAGAEQAQPQSQQHQGHQHAGGDDGTPASVEHQRCVLLHELAHAFEFRRLDQAGFKRVQAAYLKARERKLYEVSRNMDLALVSAYANASEFEYFAELSCAYLDKLNYFPFNRKNLEKYDPVGYEMIKKA
jgi:hypothetical protein